MRGSWRRCARGVDAWSEERAQAYLGADYALEDYERVTDILDVWFDSGSTHAFVLESGRWPDLMRPEGYTGPLADLYLEGTTSIAAGSSPRCWKPAARGAKRPTRQC